MSNEVNALAFAPKARDKIARGKRSAAPGSDRQRIAPCRGAMRLRQRKSRKGYPSGCGIVFWLDPGAALRWPLATIFHRFAV